MSKDLIRTWYHNCNRLTDKYGSERADRIMFEEEFIKGSHAVYVYGWWRTVSE